jgi:hypothetical protein
LNWQKRENSVINRQNRKSSGIDWEKRENSGIHWDNSPISLNAEAFDIITKRERLF